MVRTRNPLQVRVVSVGSKLIAVLTIAFLPLTISISAHAECVPPPDPGPGIHHPVGSDAAAFTYNCNNDLWESAHYIYNPSTGETTPTPQPTYTFNAATGAYDYSIWVYNAPSAAYYAVAKSTASPPAGANVVGGPTVNGIGNTGADSNNTINNNGGSGGNSINNTGTGSNNTVNGSGNNNFNGNNNTGVNVTNNLNASANTGSALVLGNTVAGSAASGDAQNIANVVNMLQSSSNAVGGNMVTFVANIDGNVNGDLMLDPSVIRQIQPASGTNNTTLNNSVDASINNTIDLSANSGEAKASNNTHGGGATSGNARTIANVVNMINSAVTSGKSFMGVININGNLNGDILLPPDFIDQLIAANVPTVNIIADTGPSSNNTVNNNGSNNTNVNNTNNLGINNNVNSNVSSGTANVSDNTHGGNATSGSAKTSITAFNLTGSNVVGSNDMLVFVNVAGGRWVGLIVNAPAGATAAELGGGIVTNTGPGSNNTVNQSGSNNTNINNTASHKINNNIKTAAHSGDASVDHNTTGGNARSGDADSAVNLLNVENSSLTLSNWFGILFINVFGTWNGSFGINTSAGDPITAAANTAAMAGGAEQAFSFAPNNGGGNGSGSSGNHFFFAPSTASGGGGNSISNSGPASSNSILAAAIKANKAKIPAAPGHINWLVIIVSGTIFVASMVGDRFYFSSRRSRA